MQTPRAMAFREQIDLTCRFEPGGGGEKQLFCHAWKTVTCWPLDTAIAKPMPSPA